MLVILVKLLQTAITFCLILVKIPSLSAEITRVKFEQCTIFVAIGARECAKRPREIVVLLSVLITVGVMVPTAL